MTATYDPIAAGYDRRYALHDYPGIRAALLEVVAGINAASVLEVGCGTGRWLALLAAAGCRVAGIDPSRAMLTRAPAEARGDLRAGVGETLPWSDGSFDVVLYVNALHHCTDPSQAIREAARVLRSGGTLLSIGLDPHERRDRWFVYDFFPEALTLDLERFASRSQRMAWLEAAGLVDVVVHPVEIMSVSTSVDEATRDGVLEQSFTSQLTALSAAEYAAGLRRIRAAGQKDDAFRLVAELTLYGTAARKPL